MSCNNRKITPYSNPSQPSFISASSKHTLTSLHGARCDSTHRAACGCASHYTQQVHFFSRSVNSRQAPASAGVRGALLVHRSCDVFKDYYSDAEGVLGFAESLHALEGGLKVSGDSSLMRRNVLLICSHNDGPTWRDPLLACFRCQINSAPLNPNRLEMLKEAVISIQNVWKVLEMSHSERKKKTFQAGAARGPEVGLFAEEQLWSPSQEHWHLSASLNWLFAALGVEAAETWAVTHLNDLPRMFGVSRSSNSARLHRSVRSQNTLPGFSGLMGAFLFTS